MALNTSFNAMAQKNLKIFFKTAVQDVENNSTPRFQLGGDVPAPALGLVVKPEGVRWANGYRWFSGWHGTPTDRLIAAYVDENTKMDSKLKISFENFPFEVNAIQWNVMNDLMSGAIFDFSEWDSDIFDNYTVNYKYTPKTGNAITGSEQHWDLNPLPKRTDFNRVDMPGASNMAMNGLTSFEFSEENYFKIGFLWWSIYSQKTALNDNCRTFLKAGWKNGMVTLPADDWAFNIKYSLPELGLRFADGRTNNTLIVDENDGNGVSLQAYISAHAGAIEPGKLLTNYNKFYYEYVSSNPGALTIDRLTGKVYPKKVGAVDVTVNLMYGKGNEGETLISSYTKTLQINEYNINESSPEICIGFVDGNKGYDIMVGDKKAQIQGFITANTPSDYSTGGYQFEYYESSNGEIITIDPATGKITPKKEGDVNITAVLKKGSSRVSNPYTYTLHVFAQHEGLDWHRLRTWYFNTSNADATNTTLWRIGSSTTYKDDYNSETSWPFNWKKEKKLKTSMNVQTTSDWKQITGFNTSAYVDEQNRGRWRAICQKVGLDVMVPKYSKASFAYTLAGNVASQKGRHYGFEVKDVGVVSSDEADKRIYAVKWITTNNSAGHSSELGSNTYPNSTVPTVLVGGVGSASVNNVAANVGMSQWDIDNKENANPVSQTRYLAVMSYLGKESIDFGTASFGYKNIPTYTYYTKVTYAKNDGTNAIVHTQSDWKTSTSKTETFKLFQGANNSEKAQLSSRVGYTFLGWSTDPNATTPEYELEDDFPIYDNVDGGGKGHVTLYAVWKPNNYIVTLHKNDGGEDETAQIEVTYEQPMPENIGLVAPTRKGYDFRGYHNAPSGGGTFYYDSDMKSAHIYDKVGDSDLYARWTIHKTEVSFDANGGVFYNNVPTVTATYNQQMPTIGVYEGNENTPIPAPSRTGYTFAGYYYPGNGTTYYNYSNGTISSARKWNIDERTLDPQVTEVTLYAKWIGNTYAVTLDPQGGTGGTTSVTATYGQPLPSGLTAPTKEGYEFKGYYSNANNDYYESIGQDSGGKQYYDKDMVGVADWDYTYSGVPLYAHWAPKTFIVTFDGTNGAIVPKQMQYDSQKPISDVIYNSDGVMKISFKYGGQCPSQITNGKFKKAGFKLVGFYDSNNVLVATVDVDHPEDRNIYFNESSGYWTRKNGNLVWNCTHDVNLTARYEPKYTVRDGDIIDFGTEYLEVGIDWENHEVHDLLGAAEAEKEAGRISSTNPVMVFDIRNAKYLDNSSKKSDKLMVPLRDKDFISPNLLVYLGEGAYDVIENEIETDGNCPGLVVTDRYPIKIPYAFKADKALYERNKAQKGDDNDGMWRQSKKSIWGTLCLPYPIKNNNTYKVSDDIDCKVIFYELYRKSGNVMQFYKLPEDAVIPANTPVLYERTEGAGSAVTIEEVSGNDGQKINVPENPNFAAATKNYSSSALSSTYDWQFIGNMQERTFYGKNHSKKFEDLLPGEEKETSDNIYYFKQDNFTRMGDKNYMILYPYRAYFREVGGADSDAKVGSYSILVVDEEGATDITNAIYGDGEGDGKIYDLNGIRVMQPVKGRLYIVNGKKKIYK